MVDLRDEEAANILLELANGVREMTGQPSENVIAGSSSASRKGKPQLCVKLREASCSELNQRKRKREEIEKKGGLADCLGGSVNHKLSPRNPMNDPVAVIIPPKKQQRSNTEFSFSIFHLLSAVRNAFINEHVEDLAYEGVSTLEMSHVAQHRLASLSVHQILEIVRLKPGDPSVLETRESLLDLIRRWLNILSSEAGPVGVVDWKPLVAYERTSRCWSWIGPVPVEQSRGDDHVAFQVTAVSSKHWGIPQQTLRKLVKCFANWLRRTQDTLRQIASLPPPPAALMQPITTGERFKNLKPHSGSRTINPSSVEVRDYFQREEALRYSIPDLAFSYTTRDGRKSTVAPLIKRRSRRKTSKRVYKHEMVKVDNRPPHLTIRSLVRDAAARLPGSVGTIGDICVLVRDSQFVVLDQISERKLKAVLTGALNRLKLATDPCIRFDRQTSLWSYLHGEMEDEDFN